MRARKTAKENAPLEGAFSQGMDKGIFAVYKAKGITSHDVIDRIRKITGERRVGHGGTLDPAASGVLVVGVGREYTKKLHQILKHSEKVYRAKIRLGATSSTDDAEGQIYEVQPHKIPAIEELRPLVKRFEGEIEQIPPAFSAIKIKGKKAYELARKGITPKLKPRKVFIKKIKLVSYQWPFLDLEITCGSGVYIRSLARDIGKALGVGAYLQELQRTRVGEFTLKDALDLYTFF
ncbi:MAG: tRNA pseudouridine(55) synthase TruB [Candidatus Colwellbacteria bacterium]|nr:tRNA pseudouridine(55) synthase TruB [Candidatus Colwellbacteria bacterium]